MSVTDWTGAGRITAELYRQMADAELHGESPTYEALCRAVADSEALCALLERLPPDKRQPNLLLAAVRYLDGPIQDPQQFAAYLQDEWPNIEVVMRHRRTQTNEAGRCASLLPVLAALPQPIALLEVGASAGLCLYPDRYAYRFRRAASGVAGADEHRIGTGAVELACEYTGAVPLPQRLPEVVWRAGLDLAPLDVTDADDRRWLASLIWPEHTDRAERLTHAMDIAAVEPPLLIRGDAVRDLAPLVSQAPSAATLVVFHSAVLAYLAPAQRVQFGRQLATIRTERGVVWISNEAPGIVAGTEGQRTGPSRFVVARNQLPLALAAPHGRTLDWL